MKIRGVISLLCFTSIVNSIYGARILGLFPYPGKSHFDFFHPLFLGLAEAGHEVTVVSYFPNKQPVANYTDLTLDSLPVIVNYVDLKMIEMLHFWLREIRLANFVVLHQLGVEACDAAFQSNAIKEVLKSSKKFDVVLVENFSNDCMLAIAHKLGAPVVGLTSHAPMPWHYNRMGSPFVSSFMPNHFLGHSSEMSFLQRLNNIVHQRLANFLYDFVTQRATNNMIRKYYGDSVPPIEDLVMNTSLMLINQHYSLNGPTPYTPGIVEIGGLHIQKAKPLDKELKQVLDNAKNGAIYVSWGSMVRPETLPEEKKNALIKALSQFDQLILLKWPKSSIPNVPKNFYLRDWMPQRDILCHPNVKVFMTHGGLLGTTEGCHCGVAVVATPFFGDQFLNVAAIEARNAGVTLHYRDLQEENIVKALRKALSPSVQESAKIISEAFRNRPMPPLELAIWWIENVVRTKGLPLAVNSSSKMHWFTYYNIDVYIALLTILFLVSIGVNKLVKKIFCTKKLVVKQKKN
ncbi:UDP-glycosyltransferase UGT5-like [Eupeodes corollae]|uniref:UDP-glycosyltransferase UGT5-like n=1 Tax=Eupeodes corollae TaxID=290404 RepID=UPI002491A9BA|nr:UDP-glycosyltransferase UGT5-like [Eupeodes corollae]XP_055920185.1 UDP-glycosyltransferase UGT5-like [Eupeodes corollae]XP_055920186.1 UDP-glycosyltransferase UGT5-like [Eupeodes corollae]